MPGQIHRCLQIIVLGCAGLFCASAWAADGRLLATGGAMPLEGAAGGGIVPWAVLSGYSSLEQTGPTAAYTYISTDDFQWQSYAASYNLFNRVELSAASQSFDIGVLTGALGFDPGHLRQDVFGIKVRVIGDIVYTPWPQIAVGAMYKHNSTFEVPQAVGAQNNTGTDFYVSATKLFLDGLLGRNILLNGTVRSTKANQIGLLGFGGDINNDRELMVELSAAIFVNKSLAFGYEYREKPDNLSFAEEDDWQDIFASYFINKHIGLVVAYADLGTIAGLSNQSGVYLSIQGSL